MYSKKWYSRYWMTGAGESGLWPFWYTASAFVAQWSWLSRCTPPSPAQCPHLPPWMKTGVRGLLRLPKSTSNSFVLPVLWFSTRHSTEETTSSSVSSQLWAHPPSPASLHIHPDLQPAAVSRLTSRVSYTTHSFITPLKYDDVTMGSNRQRLFTFLSLLCSWWSLSWLNYHCLSHIHCLVSLVM